MSSQHEPRRALVTEQEMQANIAHCDIIKHVSRGGHTLRWAVLTTANGYAVVGRPSLTVAPNKDNAAIGAVIAISNAEQELWPLMHYACKQQPATPSALPPRGVFSFWQKLAGFFPKKA